MDFRSPAGWMSTHDSQASPPPRVLTRAERIGAAMLALGLAGVVLLVQRVLRPMARTAPWPVVLREPLDWLPNLLAAFGLPFLLLALGGRVRPVARPFRPFTAECGLALLVAVLMETLQRHEVRYRFDLADLAASVAGVAAAYAIGRHRFRDPAA